MHGAAQEGRPILSNEKLLLVKLLEKVILSLLSTCNFVALSCHVGEKLGVVVQLSGSPSFVAVTKTV